MSSARWVLAASLAAASTGCSHAQEKVETNRPTAEIAPPPARALTKVAAAPPQEIQELPKPKEDDAIFFDFDSALVRDDARPVLQSVAETVRGSRRSLEIGGNCDELGTTEYNLALGEHRARAAKEYLVRLGVAPTKISTVSYGSQRPKDPGHDEQAHAKNRRADFQLR